MKSLFFLYIFKVWGIIMLLSDCICLFCQIFTRSSSLQQTQRQLVLLILIKDLLLGVLIYYFLQICNYSRWTVTINGSVFLLFITLTKSFFTQIAWIGFSVPGCMAHFGRWSRRHSGRPRHPRPTSLQTCDSGLVHSSLRLSLSLPSHSLHYKHAENKQSHQYKTKKQKQ